VALADSNRDFVIGFVRYTTSGLADLKRLLVWSCSQRRLSKDPTLLHFTPGVALAATGQPSCNSKARRESKRCPAGDGLGQQYNTPEVVLGSERQSDVIIVGRAIIKVHHCVHELASSWLGQAADPAQEAQKYQRAGWAAYEKRTASLGGHSSLHA